MKKFRRKGKAEGSVLFTVVAVMMVMVVFLMSTLILTTSANRRSYYTFYENQAQYTAQGVLDAISNAAYSDDGFNRWVTEIKNPGQVGTINVNVDDSKVAGADVTAQIERIEQYYIWNEDAAAIFQQDGWKITVTATVGNGKNRTEYTMANYVFANPDASVDIGETNNASWSAISGIDVQNTNVPGSGGGAPTTNVAKAVFCGSVAGRNSGDNLLCLGPQTYGTRALPAGKGKYGNAPTSKFTNNPQTVGDGVFVGNFEANCSVTFVAEKAGEGVQFFGDFYAQNMFEFRNELSEAYTAHVYRDIPYLYVDGNLKFNDSTSQEIGQREGGNYPVNLYVNQLTGAPQNMKGDIYMFNPEVDSLYRSMRDTRLNKFIKDNVQKTNSSLDAYAGGDIISCNKSLTISGNVCEIGGDVIMANPNGSLNIELNKDMVIYGAVLSAGGLSINCNNHNLTVVGGVYAPTAKTSITGTINGVASGSLAEICDATANLAESYEIGSTYTDETGGPYRSIIQNTSKSAHFESLGSRGADAESYDALISALLTGNLGIQYGATYYTDTNTSGYDFSMFPFCSRQDEIFTHYFRWDLASADQNTALASIGSDSLIQESMACGHTWGVTPRSAESGTMYVPYTVPVGCDISDLTDDNSRAYSDNCFIPILETSSGSPISSNQYYNSREAFISAGNIKTEETFSHLPKKSVKFTSHKADGEAVTVSLGSVPVISESCVLNLANNNNAYNLFIDPTQGHDSNHPLYIVLEGSFDNAALNIIVNNNCMYSTDNAAVDYENYTTYADLSASTGNAKYAGKSDVLIFFDSSIFATKDFVITTTGMYQQLKDYKFDVVSNPDYPGTAEWNSLYNSGSKDAYKFEMIPNIIIYGEKGFDYSTSKWGQPAFPNGFTANAEIIMPDSIFSSKSGNVANNPSIDYREFTRSDVYNPYANKNNIPNSKNLVSMGTIMVKDFDQNNNSNVPICVYLGDMNRPPDGPGQELNVTLTGGSKNSSGSAAAGNKKDHFSNDHQGMR